MRAKRPGRVARGPATCAGCHPHEDSESEDEMDLEGPGHAGSSPLAHQTTASRARGEPVICALFGTPIQFFF